MYIYEYINAYVIYISNMYILNTYMYVCKYMCIYINTYINISKYVYIIK